MRQACERRVTEGDDGKGSEGTPGCRFSAVRHQHTGTAHPLLSACRLI